MSTDLLKHYIKILLGKRDDKWPFRRLQQRIPHSTWDRSRELLRWAEDCAARSTELETPELFLADPDPVVRQGYDLARAVRDGFMGRHSGRSDIRMLVHIPSPEVSPAGYSLFRNLAEALAYLGIPARELGWDDVTEQVLEEFQPTVLITSDNQPYLARIDWSAVDRYRSRHRMLVGLTASTAEDGNTPVKGRLAWAKAHGVNFYYAFRASEYLAANEGYAQFRDQGYPLLSVEFGVNPLNYYPVPGIRRDIDYIFMGSGNYSSYLSLFPEIITRHTGFLAGKGWLHAGWVYPGCHRYLYARARIGLNLHGPFQLNAPCELTERTYILAACGIPQLVDNPKLLPMRFSEDSMFVASTPEEYPRLFEEILSSPEEAQQRALKAQAEVFASHTTLHRADGFITAICRVIDGAG